MNRNYQDDYFIGMPGSLFEKKGMVIHVYLDGKGQIRVNIQHASEPPSASFKYNTESGIDMDLTTFYKLVDVLVGIKNDWFWGEVDNGNI